MATLGTDLFSFNYVYDIVGKLIGEYNNFSPAASPCATCYLTRDHLGSVRLVTDGASNLVARHDYLPFGQEIAAGAWAGRDSWFDKQDVNQNFTGKERDSESGLDYFGARYYGSNMGRFMSPDRWIPFLGEALIAYDAAKIGNCVVNGFPTWQPQQGVYQPGQDW